MSPDTALTLCFAVATAAAVLLVFLLAWSIARPDRRVWPPPDGGRGWRFWLVWTLIGVVVAGAIAVGALDFSSLGLGGWPWRAAGAALMVLGNALAWWGVAALGGRETTGQSGTLTTRGPYRVTRNPQYLGDLLIVAGFVLLADSWLALGPAVPTAIAALAAPFAEEPWLERQYGGDYAAYKKRVPRFLGPV